MGQPQLKEIKAFISDYEINTKDKTANAINWMIKNYNQHVNEFVRISLSIKNAVNNDFMGWITYGPLSHNKDWKEIGYAIHPKYWKKGYTTLACNLFLNWIKNNLPKEDIYAEVDINNIAQNVAY